LSLKNFIFTLTHLAVAVVAEQSKNKNRPPHKRGFFLVFKKYYENRIGFKILLLLLSSLGGSFNYG